MLNQQRLGKSGIAFLFNDSDRIVAHPRMGELMAQIEERDELPTIDAIRLAGLPLASRGITPVEHDDDSEHRSDIDDLRYVIQDNGEALSAGVPKFLMSVARQYCHQA